jgi:hypothetical protein
MHPCTQSPLFECMHEHVSQLEVNDTCILDVQFGCAFHHLLQCVAFSMCNKMRGLSACATVRCTQLCVRF